MKANDRVVERLAVSILGDSVREGIATEVAGLVKQAKRRERFTWLLVAACVTEGLALLGALVALRLR